MLRPVWLRVEFLMRGINLMTRGELLSGAATVMLMMLAGLLESAIVALVVPLVYVIVDPQKFLATGFGRRISQLLDTGAVEGLFIYLAAAFVVLLVAATLLSVYSRYLSEVHSARCVNRMSRELLERVLNAPYLWLLKQNYTTLVHYLLDDVGAWRRDFIAPLFLMVQAAIMVVSPALVAIILAPVSALLALVLAGSVAGLVMLSFRHRIRDEAVKSRGSRRTMLLTLQQILLGLREIRIGGRAGHFSELFHRRNLAASDASVRLRMWTEAPSNIILLLGQIGFIVAAVALFLTNTSGVEIAAQLALIGIVATRVVPALNRFAAQVPSLVRSAPYVDALLRLVEELADLDKASRRSEKGAPIPDRWHRVVLADLWFRYPGAPGWALRSLDLEIERGKFYGFVGRSGAGKTTLVNLLLGLIEPTRGSMQLDGRSFDTLSISDWQQRFGYVPQDPFILDASIRENITFGYDFDPRRVEQAIHHARLADLIARIDGGLDGKVGERGRQLSGGQAQRLAIARAFYRRPEILFLDEATSALDSITEAEFHDSIDALRGDVTALMIAHRVTSLRRCDRIFVLDKGEIVASGNYGELLERCDIFRALAAQADDHSPTGTVAIGDAATRHPVEP